MSEERKHWLARPENIRKLWIGFAIVLVLTVLADAFVHRSPHFDVEGIFGFYAGYGFLTCVVMVLVAKLLGQFLKRNDTYYDD